MSNYSRAFLINPTPSQSRNWREGTNWLGANYNRDWRSLNYKVGPKVGLGENREIEFRGVDYYGFFHRNGVGKCIWRMVGN